jgi:peroxin-5
VIRARSAIMARHLHADAHGSGVARAQLEHALAPLGVEVSLPPHAGGADARMEGPRHIQGARGAERAAVGAAPFAAPPFAAPETAADARRRFLEASLGGPAGPDASVAAGWADDFAKLRVSRGGAEAAAGPATAAAVPGPGGPGGREAGPPGAERWAEEFSGVKSSAAGAAWAAEFHSSTPDAPEVASGDAWASEFRQEQESRSAAGSDAPLTAAQAETAAQSARLVATLAADPEGKFRNSQFLQFMSRMSRGELVAEGDGVTERSAAGAAAGATAVGDAWASEYAAARADGGAAVSAADPSGWAGEFRARSASTAVPSASGGAHRWADEFADWAGGDWAGEFQEMAARGEVDGWTHDSVWNAIGEESKALAAERSRYEFVDPNPYLGRADALAVGRDLFRRGVLSEAALALEAAVRADPASCEGWRLLSTVHAENDDDRRAIAAATKAHEADPSDLEALLSLGVSHTNELDAEEATGFMRAWLAHQPRFKHLEREHAAQFASNPSAGATPAATLALFKRAAAAAPRDADVHAVLGVLAHLCRSYDEAIAAFNAALDINPRDYSLWNKLGATQANSARSAEAMAAYQRALDLKPNYVRAWANMGIGYANQGKYEKSVGFYVRALSLNPRAESVWGYLRISLGCCGRIELMEAVDNKDLARLQAEFPL